MNNQLVIDLFNADDNLRAKVNGVTVAEIGYGGSTSRDVTSSLRKGANTVDIELENTMSAWTYGYRMRADGALVVNETCGQAGTTPCNSDRTLGIVYRRTYSIWKN